MLSASYIKILQSLVNHHVKFAAIT